GAAIEDGRIAGTVGESLKPRMRFTKMELFVSGFGRLSNAFAQYPDSVRKFARPPPDVMHLLSVVLPELWCVRRRKGECSLPGPLDLREEVRDLIEGLITRLSLRKHCPKIVAHDDVRVTRPSCISPT